MLSPCEYVSGVVATEPQVWKYDGDYYFNLRLDPGQDRFLNEGNMKRLGGTLHIEIEPNERRLKLAELPKLGMHIVVVGVWVLDTGNNWNEIHPVWFWAQVAP